jgi:hypothetical protein
LHGRLLHVLRLARFTDSRPTLSACRAYPTQGWTDS